MARTLPRRRFAPPARRGEARDIQGSWHSITYGSVPLNNPANRVSEQSALSLVPVYAAINRIATDLSSLCLRVFERTANSGRAEAVDLRQNEMLGLEPNPEMPSDRFRKALQGHLLGWGNAYSEIEITRGGDPVNLWPLPPSQTLADRTSTGKLVYLVDNGRRTLPPDRVLHLAGLGYDGIKGYSPVRMARNAIALGKSAESSGLMLFGNGHLMGGVVTLEKELSPDAQRNLREQIGERHQGVENAHLPLILDDGAKWNPTAIPPEDAQFLESRRFQTIEIARLYGLPPWKIGDYSDATLANIENANLDYVMSTLVGWAVVWEQEINRKLFTGADRRRYFAEFSFLSFLRGNMAARSQFYKELFQMGVFTPNEIRRRENLDPIGADGDRHFVPLNMTTLDQVGREPAGPGPGPADPAARARWILDPTRNGASHHEPLDLAP